VRNLKELAALDFNFNRKSFMKDLLAGISVAVVALPLALGFGLTSGLSAASGLTTAIIAGFLAALFGGSRLSSFLLFTVMVQARFRFSDSLLG
jgi:MFS superfamily sulfate permease-like transporter